MTDQEKVSLLKEKMESFEPSFEYSSFDTDATQTESGSWDISLIANDVVTAYLDETLVEKQFLDFCEKQDLDMLDIIFNEDSVCFTITHFI